MRKGFLIGLVCLIGHGLAAQYGYYREGLLFSQTSFNGTARIQGIGGAQVALGGDLSLAASNPAGLGFFNRGVFSITPQVQINQSDGQYLGEQASEGVTKFNIGQLGLGLYYGDGAHANEFFRGGMLAITTTRVNDFNSKRVYEGTNNSHSIINSMLENPSQGIVDGAYENFLLNQHPHNYIFDEDFGEILGFDTIPGFNGYSSPFDLSVPRQREYVETSGGQYSINVAYGANFGDVLYLGAGVGMQTVEYDRTSVYEEWDYFVVTERLPDGSVSGFPEDVLDRLRIEDRLNIQGVGVNGDFGLTLRPIPFLTVGLAYKTPTIYALEEEGSFDFHTQYFDKYDYTVVTIDETAEPDDRYVFETFDLEEHEYLSDVFSSFYTLTVPGKLNIGSALFLGKRGFLTADFEFIDYRNIKLNSDEFSMDGDNEFIQSNYRAVMNGRMGAELRFGTVKLRGGYAFMPDPYQSEEYDRTIQLITGGLGFRNEKFFADLTGTYQWQNDYVSPYEISDDQYVATLELSKINVITTLGFVF